MTRTTEQSVTALDARALWEKAMAGARLRDVEFTTLSGHPLQALYGPEDADVDVERDLGLPGSFPYTRGVHATMYRARLWTMRQFAGFGSARQTNERFKFLLAHGQTVPADAHAGSSPFPQTISGTVKAVSRHFSIRWADRCVSPL